MTPEKVTVQVQVVPVDAVLQVQYCMGNVVETPAGVADGDGEYVGDAEGTNRVVRVAVGVGVGEQTWHTSRRARTMVVSLS